MEVNMTRPTYLGGGDPDGKDYYPAWIDDLADDVTVEGSLLDGAAEGPEAVRTIAGPYGDNGWLEDYAAQVGGEPIGCAVLITSASSTTGPARRSASGPPPRNSPS
jgi:hypothetical protein